MNNPESAVERRNQILDLMHRQGRIQIAEDKYFQINEEQLDLAKAEPINIAVKRFPIEAPHFVLQYVEPQLRRIFGCDAAPQYGASRSCGRPRGKHHPGPRPAA